MWWLTYSVVQLILELMYEDLPAVSTVVAACVSFSLSKSLFSSIASHFFLSQCSFHVSVKRENARLQNDWSPPSKLLYVRMTGSHAGLRWFNIRYDTEAVKHLHSPLWKTVHPSCYSSSPENSFWFPFDRIQFSHSEGYKPSEARESSLKGENRVWLLAA